MQIPTTPGQLPQSRPGSRGALVDERPSSAMILFDGSDLDGWTTLDGRPAPWRISDGALEVVPGSGDICSRLTFLDFQLHLEFCVPAMPGATGQDRGNSGVFLLGRYEIQVLDSFGMEPTDDGCGAIYGMKPPLVNACLRPEAWQSYDIAFRSPRLDTNGMIVAHPRLTMFMNGLLVHNNVELPRPTPGPLDPYEALPGPIRLQDHGSPVRFKNIWVVLWARSGRGTVSLPEWCTDDA